MQNLCFSKDEEEEIKYILQKIENASKEELKLLEESWNSFISYKCKSMFKVACNERLIKLGLKAPLKPFENREKVIRRNWLVMLFLLYIAIPLIEIILFPKDTLQHTGLYFFGPAFWACIIYYFAFLKKGTKLLAVITFFGVIIHIISFFMLISTPEDFSFSLLYIGALYLLTTFYVWASYRLYKINHEALGRRYLACFN